MLAAVFCSLDDVFGNTFAAESIAFGLEKERNGETTTVETRNLSVYKGVLLSRDRVAGLLNISTDLDAIAFRTKFEQRVNKLTDDQAQNVLTICQVRPMAVPVENQHLHFGTPVTASFIAINRSAFLANVEPNQNDSNTLSSFGKALVALKLPVADEVGLQLMLAPRIVVANRTISKGQSTYSGMDFDDDDSIEEVVEEIENNPTTLTVDAANGLTTDELKKYVTKYTDKVVRTAAGKIDTVATRTALVGVTVL